MDWTDGGDILISSCGINPTTGSRDGFGILLGTTEQSGLTVPMEVDEISIQLAVELAVERSDEAVGQALDGVEEQTQAEVGANDDHVSQRALLDERHDVAGVGALGAHNQRV